MNLKELNRLAVTVPMEPKTKLTRKEQSLSTEVGEFDEEEWVECSADEVEDEDLAVALGLLDDAANLMVALADPHLSWTNFVKGRKSLQMLGDEIYKFIRDREQRQVLQEILDGEVERGKK